MYDGQAAQLRLGADDAIFLNAESRGRILDVVKGLIVKAEPTFDFYAGATGKLLAYANRKQPQTTAEGTNMKENNAAAILREDTRTVHVVFPNGDKSYTYVSNIQDLAEGDQVIVPSNTDDNFSLAIVTKVDPELNIEPGSNIRYRFVAAKVDLAPYRQLLEENATINKALADNYRNNARQQFRAMMLQDNPMLAALTAKKLG
jgi:hypothetical protein